MSAVVRETRWSGVPDWKFGFTEVKNITHYWDHFWICITAFWHKEVKAQVGIWTHLDCFHLLVLGFCFLFYYTGQLGRNYWVQDMTQIKFDPASLGEDYNVSTAFMWQSVLIQARSTTHPSSSQTAGLTLKGWTDRELISEWMLLWVLGKYLMRQMARSVKPCWINRD